MGFADLILMNTINIVLNLMHYGTNLYKSKQNTIPTTTYGKILGMDNYDKIKAHNVSFNLYSWHIVFTGHMTYLMYWHYYPILGIHT